MTKEVRYNYIVAVSSPEYLTDRELNEVYELTMECGAVEHDGLMDRLKRAHLIGRVLFEGELICTCSVKCPTGEYLSGVFEAAGSTENLLDFRHEIGYSATREAFRDEGMWETLLIKLLSQAKGVAMYATTRSEKVIRRLAKHGFRKSGAPFKNGLWLLIYKPIF